jgi:hypothetical protein
MSNRVGRFVLPLAAVLLSGCQTRPLPEVEDVGPVEPRPPAVTAEIATCPREPVAQLASELDDLMNYYAGLRLRTPGALKQDLDDAKREFATNGSEPARLKLAMLYLLPNAAFRNEVAAVQLLDPYQRGEGRGGGRLRGLAQVLLAGIEINRRTDAMAVATATKLKDEQRKTEELQRKLDALRDVERAMIQKDQGARKP